MQVTQEELWNALALRQALAAMPRDRVLDAVDRMRQPLRYFLGVTLSSVMASEQGWGVNVNFGMEN